MKAALLVLMVVALSGCAIAPPAPPDAGRAQSLSDFPTPDAPDEWALSARAALAVDGEGASAAVSWRHSPQRWRLLLRGALGAGATRLEGAAGGVRLTLADGRTYRGEDPRVLLARLTGFDLPLRHLRWWIVGRPVPGIGGRVTVAPEGDALAYRQAGWAVTLGDYRNVDAYRLPHRLSVIGDGLRLRVRIREWQVPP